MDVNKIIEMLEREEKTPVVPKRGAVAKESLIRASGGDLDAINNLLEEDIMLDSRQSYALTHREKPARESIKTSKQRIAEEETDDEFASRVSKMKKKEAEAEHDKQLDITRRTHFRSDAEQAKRRRKIAEKRMKEAEESIGSDVAKYQKWVDDDMERFGHISQDTKRFIKKAGLSIVKDQYGEYEVIAKTEPAKECDSTSVGVDNPIPSPVRKKGAKEDENCSKANCGKSRPTNEACAVEEEEETVEETATEEVLKVTQSESVFPEEVEFDEEAFGELIGIAPEEILVSYVQEDENEPEHFELRFKKDEKEVLLKLNSDGTTSEVVDARIIDKPEFSYAITQDDEGNFLLLVSPEEVEEEEETDFVKSEGDTDPGDEKGEDGSDEFIQENGLKLDGEYQRVRGEKPDKNASKPVKESFAQKKAKAQAKKK